MAWMKQWEAVVRLPDLLVGRLDFEFDFVPFRMRSLSHAKRVNLLKAGFDLLTRGPIARAMPAIIQFEPTNTCNLKCPLCPTGVNAMGRPKGMMSADRVQRVLEEIGDTLLLAVLYGWGEPFLNKDLPRMIAACTARGVETFTSTNGHLLQTVEEALAVVDAGLSALVFAVDGSSQESYASYRKTGRLDRVIRCIESVEKAKLIRGSAHPYTNLRVVVTRHNEGELDKLEALAGSLGVNMFSYKSLGCLIGEKQFNGMQFNGMQPAEAILRRFAGDNRRGKELPRCPYPFRQPTVFWDGTVVGCEFDYNLEKPWGRIGEQRFRDIWNGPAAQQMRQSLAARCTPDFCARCPYAGREGSGCVVRAVELKAPGIGMAAGS